MHHKENHSTTYAGILHYTTKLSRGSRGDVRESLWAFTVMDVGGGNSTDDPIEYRDLLGANQRGEGKYRNEHRTEKHFEASDPLRLRTLYLDNRPRAPRPGTTRTIMRFVFYSYIWPPGLHHRGTILEVPVHFNWAVDGRGQLELNLT